MENITKRGIDMIREEKEDRKYNIRTKDTSTTIGCTKSLEELCLENGYGYDSGYNEVI